jgi:hypothetical protein
LEAVEGFHLDCDRLIVRAGNLKDEDEGAPIRTVIVFPPWIYGVSDGEFMQFNPSTSIPITNFALDHKVHRK